MFLCLPHEIDTVSRPSTLERPQRPKKDEVLITDRAARMASGFGVFPHVCLAMTGPEPFGSPSGCLPGAFSPRGAHLRFVGRDDGHIGKPCSFCLPHYISLYITYLLFFLGIILCYIILCYIIIYIYMHVYIYMYTHLWQWCFFSSLGLNYSGSSLGAA